MVQTLILKACRGGHVLGKGFVLLTLRLKPHKFDTMVHIVGFTIEIQGHRKRWTGFETAIT